MVVYYYRIGVLFTIIMVTACGAINTPYYEAPKGNNYEVGFAIGKQFAQRIQDFCNNYEPLKVTLRPFFQNKLSNIKLDGSKIVADFIEDQKAIYPHYVEELRGISDGSGVDMDTLWLINLEIEINGIVAINKKDEKEHCSDVHVNNQDTLAMGHNEDALPIIGEYAYLVRMQVNDEPVITGYNYPAMLMGYTFGMNSNGIAFTINTIWPKNVTNRGVTVAFMCRELFAAKSVEDAIHIFRTRSKVMSNGMSLNLGSVKLDHTYNIEVGHGVIDIKMIDQSVGSYSHFNMYKRLTVPQWLTNSTQHRIQRYQQLGDPKTEGDVKAILGDTGDKEWPIFRTAQAPDLGMTVATAYFDLKAGTFDMYEDNPKLATTKPVYTFQLVN